MSTQDLGRRLYPSPEWTNEVLACHIPAPAHVNPYRRGGAR